MTTTLRIVIALTALQMGVVVPPASAQQYRWGFDLGLDVMSGYPSSIEPPCTNGRGLGPSARAHYRPHRLLSLEAGISYQVALGDVVAIDCGRRWIPPFGTPQSFREHDVAPRDASLTTEGRIVLTPTGDRPASLRAIGGGVLYAANPVRGWLVGAGIEVRRAWGGIILDLERWHVGTPYTAGTATLYEDGSVDRRVESEGTDWDSHWQLRVAFLLGSR